MFLQMVSEEEEPRMNPLNFGVDPEKLFQKFNLELLSLNGGV